MNPILIMFALHALLIVLIAVHVAAYFVLVKIKERLATIEHKLGIKPPVEDTTRFYTR